MLHTVVVRVNEDQCDIRQTVNGKRYLQHASYYCHDYWNECITTKPDFRDHCGKEEKELEKIISGILRKETAHNNSSLVGWGTREAPFLGLEKTGLKLRPIRKIEVGNG